MGGIIKLNARPLEILWVSGQLDANILIKHKIGTGSLLLFSHLAGDTTGGIILRLNVLT
jgi:hypothetical protein